MFAGLTRTFTLDSKGASTRSRSKASGTLSFEAGLTLPMENEELLEPHPQFQCRLTSSRTLLKAGRSWEKSLTRSQEGATYEAGKAPGACFQSCLLYTSDAAD